MFVGYFYILMFSISVDTVLYDGFLLPQEILYSKGSNNFFSLCENDL